MRLERVIATAKDTDWRLSEQVAPERGAATDAGTICLDPAVTYQELLGFGGAFTEAAAVTFYKLPPERQAEVLRAYFDPQQGHGYTMGRTHINSCDFSLGNYACDDVPGDVELKHFSLARERQALLPFIKAALSTAGAPLKLLASPWSPPAWMKTNGEMNHGGQLKPEYRAVWATYYCRFIEACAQEGVPIWGLTVQNEPEATQTWDSCRYTAEEERDFVRDFLGPALHRHGLQEVRLFIWDHNRDRLYERAKVVYDDPQAAPYVWGAAFHWYEHPQRFDNVQRTHDAYPDKHLLFSEGCQEGGPHLGEWGVGERYAHAIINDLNAWTEGWLDWNLLLDERGGPNHVGNYCSAPMIADTRTGELLYQSSYYYIGHFARFIRPGARRIGSAVSAEGLEATAFRNSDGRIALVVLNLTDQPRPFTLEVAGARWACTAPARGIQTYLIAEE